MKNKGTILVEQSLFLMVVLSAVLLMTVYIWRSVQGRMRNSLSDIGKRYEYGGKTSVFSYASIQRNNSSNIVFSAEDEDFASEETEDEFIDTNRDISEDRTKVTFYTVVK